MDPMTRFDVPEWAKKMIDVAVAGRIVDPLEAYCLGAEFGTDFDGLADSLINTAYIAAFPGPESARDTHAALCKIRETDVAESMAWLDELAGTCEGALP